MSNRYYRAKVLTQNPRMILLAGKITLSAAGAVVSHTIDQAASVTKTGTGEYTIVLQDKFVETKRVAVSHEGTALDSAKVKADTIATNKTLVINTIVSGAVANVATVCVLHVEILAKDSTVTK